MISNVQGSITEKLEKSIVINIGGIGISVFVNSELIANSSIDQTIKLFTHFNVKEDALQLYGFDNKEARDFFKNLISVSGVGPKSAMEILEAPLDHIKKAIIDNNIGFLSQIKGLGKKTAQKIILELESKITLDNNLQNTGIFFSEELIFALQNLGFKRKDIFTRLQDLPNEIHESEDIIRWFLKQS